MSATNLLTATGTQIELDNGRTSIPQIVKDHQSRYGDRDLGTHAWVLVRHSQILLETDLGAKEQVEKGSEKLLRGVTIGVKDILTTKDMSTKYGSRIYQDCNQPGLDATVVALCREQGGLILGKTATAEFASGSDVLPTNNPIDVTRTTGYSSAGSVAAVADYQCHVAIGTQTISSIIEPASFTGIFGYKPTPSLDTIGFFARCVPDLQLLARVCNIIPGVLSPSHVTLNSCRFGFVETDQWEEHASDDLRQVWPLAKKILTDAGATVEDISLGSECGNMGYSYDICDKEVATSLLAHYRSDKADLSDGLKSMVETGGGISHLDAQRHRDHIATLRPKFDRLFGNCHAKLRR